MRRFAVMLLAVASAATMTTATSMAQNAPERLHLHLPVGFVKMLQLPDSTANVVVGNPDVADITRSGAGPTTYLLHGKTHGQTNILVLDEHKEIYDAIVTVTVAANEPDDGLFGNIQIHDQKDGLYDYVSYYCHPACEFLKSPKELLAETAARNPASQLLGPAPEQPETAGRNPASQLPGPAPQQQ